MIRATCLAVLLCVSSAGAAPRRLAVVELFTPPNMAGLGSQLTQLLLEDAHQQGYQLLPPELLQGRLDEKARERLRECNGAPACVAGGLAGIPAQRAVVGTLSRDQRAYLLRLWLIDLETREVLSTVDRSIPIASRRLIPDASEAIPALLRGEREARGTLVVKATAPNARVTVDGADAGLAPASVQLKPGKHSVRVEKRAHLTVERLVTVEANQTTEEEFRILLAPGELPPPEEEQPKVARVTSTAEAPRFPAGAWVAYAGALAAGGGAVFFGSQARAAEASLRATYQPDKDLYLGTRAQALDGQRAALVANVLFGAGGVLLGTGVVATILENAHPAPVRVTPVATPGGAALLLHGRF